MQNIKHGRREPLTCFRKIALSYWKHPTDPSTYSSLDLSMGIDNAYIPLSPYSRCPLIVGIAKPREVSIVKNGEVVVDTRVSISFTADHRYADGFHGAQMLRRFQKVFESPEHFPPVFESGARGTT